MTWLALPLTAFISLQSVCAPSAQEQQDTAFLVAERTAGAPVIVAGDREGRPAGSGDARPAHHDACRSIDQRLDLGG